MAEAALPARAANDAAGARPMRAWVVEVSRGGVPIKTFEVPARTEADAVDIGMEWADSNGRVRAHPLIEMTSDEGRRSAKAGRRLHDLASLEAVLAYTAAQLVPRRVGWR